MQNVFRSMQDTLEFRW